MSSDEFKNEQKNNINGVEDMTYMTSSAAVGSASVTVYFRQGINADMAAVNVQNLSLIHISG